MNMNIICSGPNNNYDSFQNIVNWNIIEAIEQQILQIMKKSYTISNSIFIIFSITKLSLFASGSGLTILGPPKSEHSNTHVSFKLYFDCFSPQTFTLFQFNGWKIMLFNFRHNK